MADMGKKAISDTFLMNQTVRISIQITLPEVCPQGSRQLKVSIGSGHVLLSGVPDYFGRNKISSGGDLSHYSSASLY